MTKKEKQAKVALVMREFKSGKLRAAAAKPLKARSKR